MLEQTVTESESLQAGKKGVGKALRAAKGGRYPIFRRLLTVGIPDPYLAVKWTQRDVVINDVHGKKIFEQKGIETPEFWSQNAINIVASKYFYGAVNTPERENSVRSLVSRVAETITGWGVKQGYFKDDSEREAFRLELTFILLNQYAAFNSPVWFNVGVQEKPQCSACFILSVEDSIESLTDLQALEARLFKYGSGCGSNLSTVRSSKEKLTGGGTPSGPVSFMRGYDAWANIIKSGGKTRRAAKMQILNVTHPDIMEFITVKKKEEQKAWALIDAGYESTIGVAGSAYDAVGMQNANFSVRVTDEFMQSAEAGKKFWTKRVKDGKPCEELDGRELLKAIAEGTWICGDPGLQFDTTINDWHTCPNSGRINGSNPCSEYMHVDDSACNLSSINVLKFLRSDGTFDVETYRHVISIMTAAQDMLIDNSSYPLPKIGENAHSFRQLGLGFANLGALLMSLGVAYDSDVGRSWAAALSAIMTGQGYLTSSDIAEAMGPFEKFPLNKEAMLRVMEKHRAAVDTEWIQPAPDSLKEAAKIVWDEAVKRGREHGYRNAQATVLAPTGTISFLMDCDTTGVEPDIALVKYKKLAGGGVLKLVNQSVEYALTFLGYSKAQRDEIVKFIADHDTIEGAPHLKPEHLSVFDCALRPISGTRNIHYLGHLKMMAACQPFLSGAISKTVNLPKEVTEQEVADIYFMAWKLGLKAVALYRDGSKRFQPLSLKEKAKDKQEVVAPLPGMMKDGTPRRHKLPDERHAITHKFSVGGLEGYITVGLFEDGSPGEIFLCVAKEGSTLSGVMDAFATAISIALQYGVPLGALARKFTHIRFEPSGFTCNPQIPMAKSVIDYVFKWLGSKFLSQKEQADIGLHVNAGPQPANQPSKESNGHAHAHLVSNGSAGNGSAHKQAAEKPALQLAAEKPVAQPAYQAPQVAFVNLEDAPPCTSCGSGLMVRQGACYVCLNCGSQGGCG